MSEFKCFSAIVFFISLFSFKAFGCIPAVPTICQAYSRADAVFIGTLIKVEKIEKSPGDCSFDKISEVGEKYFVYKGPYDGIRIADLTHKLGTFPNVLKHVESLSKSQPTFTIGGRINGLTPYDIKKLTLTIREDHRQHEVPVNENGFFEFVAKRNADYDVKISFPFKGDILMRVINLNWLSKGESLEYGLSFKPNECDFREIEISKRE